MKPNVGTIDRALRLILGLGVIIWGAVTHSWLGVIGLVPLLTAAIRWCPAYTPFGINTCGRDKTGGCGGGSCC
ncbi:MAG: DUF2892 domain-containing protein [Verrucomicrobiaceae bacterium]|nr:DUF2892 domain-containing protein [Verrucomicrobiaceae bacterium]